MTVSRSRVDSSPSTSMPMRSRARSQRIPGLLGEQNPQAFPELVAAAGEPRHHRSGRNARYARDLPVGHAFELPQHDHFTEYRREFRQGATHESLIGAAHQKILSGRLFARDFKQAFALAIAARQSFLERDYVGGPFTHREPAIGDIAHDGQQPWLDVVACRLVVGPKGP